MLLNILKNKKIYQFIYNNKPRLVLALGDNLTGNVKCWDFVNKGYRTYRNHLMEDVTNVTSNCVITSNLDATFENASTFEYEGELFAVRYAYRYSNV